MNILLLKSVLEIIKKISIKIRGFFYLIPGLVSFLCKKKIIFMVDGGLGSQMWQYAVGQAIERCSGVNVYYDVSAFKGQQMDILGINKRNWQLDKVHSKVKVKKATDCEVVFYRFFLSANKFREVFLKFDEKTLHSKKARYLGGYYTNVKYLECVEGYIKNIYDFDSVQLSGKNAETFDAINKSSCSVAIHIRRGDFIGWVGDVADKNYYMEAVDKMNALNKSNMVNYFVFSNDPTYCKEIFSERTEKFYYVDDNDNDDGHLDMFLMSNCHNFIICSSSVGWWAAYLSKRSETKYVIKSEPHRKIDTDEDFGYKLCPNWLPINVRRCLV